MIIITKAIKYMGGKSRKTAETREMTEDEEKTFDQAFAQMDKAFEEMDKAFDILRKI